MNQIVKNDIDAVSSSLIPKNWRQWFVRANQACFRRLVTIAFRPSIRQSLLVIFDQGFSSIASFLTGVLVARACSKTEYGLYVLGFTLLITLELVQRSLISIPFMVYSPQLANSGRFRESFAFGAFAWLANSLGIGKFFSQNLIFACRIQSAN